MSNKIAKIVAIFYNVKQKSLKSNISIFSKAFQNFKK